jgi:Tfp pilus assembly protein PilO
MQDFIDNAQPRVVAMMMVSIVLLITLVEVTYLLWPQIKSYKHLHSNYQVLERVVAGNDSLNSQLQNIDNEVQDLSRELHGDMAQLPVKQMESFVIGRLQKVSWDTDIELVSVQPGRGKQVQNFRERLFEVKLSARYHDFFEWLQIINQELGYIVVKKFEINPDGRDEVKNPRLNLVLTLVSYRMEPTDAS